MWSEGMTLSSTSNDGAWSVLKIYMIPQGIHYHKCEQRNTLYAKSCRDSLLQYFHTLSIRAATYLSTVLRDSSLYILPTQAYHLAICLHQV